MRRTLTKITLALFAVAFLAGCEFYMPDSRTFKHSKWDEEKGQYVMDNRGE